MLPLLVRRPSTDRVRSRLSPLWIAGPRNCGVRRRKALWSPRAARSARNSFQAPGCVSTRNALHRLIVALSLRSAAFLSKESVLYNLRLSCPEMGIAAIA